MKRVAQPPARVERIAIADLVPDPANPRRIGEAELDALCRSMQEFGFPAPIIAQRTTRRIIDGHQRLLAARRLGLATVPVIVVDVDDAQARLLNLALNKIRGEWDEALLARLLADLDASAGVDVSLSGFGEDEVRQLLRTLETRERRHRVETFDVAAAIEQARKGKAKTQPGDRWQLGNHVLICGDATDPATVHRLLDGRQARMGWLDPPYNVALGDHGGQQRGQRKRRLANDALAPAEWLKFSTAWVENLLKSVDGACYVCMSTKEWPTVSRLLAEAGAHWSDTIIWRKDRHVLGRADYQRSYEPVWYGWPDGAKRHWCGDRDQQDVWEIPRAAVNAAHPTAKPLELVERAIANSSEPGDLVLDTFLGSGTTLIAAERTGRVCAGLELDPHYCDVVIARWQAFTGDQAVRA